MRKSTRTMIIILLSMLSLTVNATGKDWTKVISAIIKVESKGNTKAVNKNGSCVGLLQITPICLKECNTILKSKNSSKRFKLSDRYNREKSEEMFSLIQEKYNPSDDIETAIRLWNGGIGGIKNKKKTNSYLKKVMKYYNEEGED